MRNLRLVLILSAISITANADPKTFDVDGVSVSAALDHDAITLGDHVKLTVAATALKPTKLGLEILVLRWRFASEDHGFYRVLARERVSVRANADVATTRSFQLGDRASRCGATAKYMIAVLPAGAERLRIGDDYKTYMEEPEGRAELRVEGSAACSK